MIGIFHFSSGNLYITKSDENFDYDIKFDTSLQNKITNTNLDNLKYSYELDLEKQQHLSDEEKNKIKYFYALLNHLVNHVSYSFEKTHIIDNFNDV